MPAALKHKEKIVRQSTNGVSFLMKKNRVDVAAGFGRLAGAGRVSVTGADGAETVYAGKNVLVATGSTPRSLPGMDIDEKTVLSSTGMLDLAEVPKSLVVIGSGAVGVEFASMHARFGAKVTIVEVLPRIVPVEDEEISRELAASFKRQGIAIYPDTRVERMTRNDAGVEILARSSGGQDRDLPRREGADGRRAAPADRRHRARVDGDRDREGLRPGRPVHAHERPGRLRHRRRAADAGPGAPGLGRGRRRRRAHGRTGDAPDQLRPGPRLHVLLARGRLDRADGGEGARARLRRRRRQVPVLGRSARPGSSTAPRAS